MRTLAMEVVAGDRVKRCEHWVSQSDAFDMVDEIALRVIVTHDDGEELDIKVQKPAIVEMLRNLGVLK